MTTELGRPLVQPDSGAKSGHDNAAYRASLVELIPAPDIGESPLPKLVAAWLLGYSSTHTRRAYSLDTRQWLDWLDTHDVDPLTAERGHVAAFARNLEHDGKSPDTVARKIASLASFYGWLLSEGHVGVDPTSAVRRPKLSPDASPTVGLDRGQAAALLAAAHADRPVTRARSVAVATLLLFNALRVGELVALRLDDLGHDRGHRTIRIHGKGGRTRVAPLAPVAADAVDTYLAQRGADTGAEVVAAGAAGGGPMLVTKTGRGLAPSTVFRLVRRLVREAAERAADQQLPHEELLRLASKVSPHSLRHTAITAALDAGISLRDAQDLAGHADPRQTRRYDRRRHNLDRHATYTLAAYLGGGEH